MVGNALPTDLDTLLEAVEVMMGEEFAGALDSARWNWHYRLEEFDRAAW